MKLTAFALIGMIMSTAATAQTVAPFGSDGCVPGFNAQGQFLDEKGYVLDSAGWVATADHKVLNAAGQQVFLKKTCLGRLARVHGRIGAGAGGNMGVALGLGVLVAAVAAGGASSTNGTN
jgi:hypothetical protein